MAPRRSVSRKGAITQRDANHALYEQLRRHLPDDPTQWKQILKMPENPKNVKVRMAMARFIGGRMASGTGVPLKIWKKAFEPQKDAANRASEIVEDISNLKGVGTSEARKIAIRACEIISGRCYKYMREEVGKSKKAGIGLTQEQAEAVREFAEHIVGNEIMTYMRLEIIKTELEKGAGS